MIGISHINKIREYCDYLEEHLLNVEKSWEILQSVCKDLNIIYDDCLFWSIEGMVQAHDISKLSSEEFIPYQQNFFPVGEKDSSGFDSAWQHHLTNNPHHWKTWPQVEERFPNEHTCHCVCMILDWMAMGMKFGGTAEEYYEKNRGKINLPPWAVRFIQEIFDRLRNP